MKPFFSSIICGGVGRQPHRRGLCRGLLESVPARTGTLLPSGSQWRYPSPPEAAKEGAAMDRNGSTGGQSGRWRGTPRAEPGGQFSSETAALLAGGLASGGSRPHHPSPRYCKLLTMVLPSLRRRSCASEAGGPAQMAKMIRPASGHRRCLPTVGPDTTRPSRPPRANLRRRGPSVRVRAADSGARPAWRPPAGHRAARPGRVFGAGSRRSWPSTAWTALHRRPRP